MRRGIGRLRAGGSGLNPIPALFTAGEQGAWFDMSDMSTMFQDSAGTTPVTATGQSVGKILDKSGRGNHATQATAGSRPILQRDAGGFLYLDFDGLDDRLGTSAVDLSATAKATVWTGARKNDTTRGVIFSSGSTFATAGSFDIESNNTAGNYAFFLNGNALGESYTNTVYTAPVSNVLSCAYDISQGTNAAQIVQRVNGATPTISSRVGTAGTGNFGNIALSVASFGNLSAFFFGRVYQLVLRGATTSAADIASTERFVGSRMGITL